MSAKAELAVEVLKAAEELAPGGIILDGVRGAWSKPSNDLITSTIKTVGGKQFRADEGTGHLDLTQLSDEVDKSKLFTIGKVKEVFSDEGRGWSFDNRSAVSPDGKPLGLFAPSRRAIFAKDELESFAQNIETQAGYGKYSAIIADDVSGRVPSLFVHDRLQRLAELRGSEPPKLFFIAGGRAGVGDEERKLERWRNIAERVESEGSGLTHGRALLITEVVETGQSLEQFSKAFRHAGVKFDIAAMGAPSKTDLMDIFNSDVELIKGQRGSGTQLYSGGAGNESPLRKAIGVEKYYAEATSRKTGLTPARTRQLRETLYELGRLAFERTH